MIFKNNNVGIKLSIANRLATVSRPCKWTKLEKSLKIKFLMNSTDISYLNFKYFYLISYISEAENPGILFRMSYNYSFALSHNTHTTVSGD